MDQSNRGNYRKQETPIEAFYHSCLGKLIILAAVLGVFFVLGVMSKPSHEEMANEMVDDILQCIAANDSIRGDKIDDYVKNLSYIFSSVDTAEVNADLRTSLNKNNRMEIYNHSWFRTAYIFNNIHPEGIRVGWGLYGFVVPTVTYDDLLLNVGPMQKKYKDGIIRSTVTDTHDMGSNPNVKPYHYQGDPDQ